jgi:uncharacterized membrane protein
VISDRRDERRGVARLEAFSDGVFAIAITLLVLGIEVPDVDADRLGTALSDLLPSVFGYFLGFAVIGLFWIAHHSFFAVVERRDIRLLWTNLLFLSLIAAMPFSSGLIGDYGDTSLATIVFATNVALAALADRLSETEARRAGLLQPEAAARMPPFLSRNLLIPTLFLCSIPIALLSPGLAQLSWLGAFVLARLQHDYTEGSAA